MIRRELFKMKFTLSIAPWVLFAALVSGSCAKDSDPLYGSQTNWFLSCKTNADCEGALECLCGACTIGCESTTDCEGLNASCAPRQDAAVVELCSGEASPISMCLVSCSEAPCPQGTACSLGACVPSERVEATITIDTDERYQALVGFGASLAYGEAEMTAHPQKGALFDAMFTSSGFDVIRMGNRFEPGQEQLLGQTGEIIEAARARMDPAPTLLMTAGSPPASFKENGSKLCSGNPDTCTLKRLEAGGFDYAGLAEFWRETLVQYGAVGVRPDYLSLQNNPDWVPPSSVRADACHFLPQEGMETVEMDGESSTLSFPGYQEALAALEERLADFEGAPRLLGPEASSLEAVLAFTPALNTEALSALAIHLYDSEGELSEGALAEVRNLAAERGLPVFQTEMNSDGLSTAELLHRALTEANAAMYLQNDFTSSASALEPNSSALIHLTSDSFTLQAPYYALAHYAYATAPGYVRVAVDVSGPEALVSAWLSPSEEHLTVVALNRSDKLIRLRIDSDSLKGFDLSETWRTNLGGGESWASLGEFPSEGSLELPATSLVTVSLRK